MVGASNIARLGVWRVHPERASLEGTQGGRWTFGVEGIHKRLENGRARAMG